MASEQTQEKRNANMDLLRLLSMMMVTMLHALGKSDLLRMMGNEMPFGGYVAWVLEALSISAVNVFMLLSGYYLIHSKFKLIRLFELIFQVFFYVIGSLLVFVIVGKVSLSSLTIYDCLQYVFPVHMEVYWFITAYVVLYLLLPILANGVKALTEKQLRVTLICLLVYECAFKSVLPMRLTTDTRGYTFFWYAIVFLLGAYIRLHGFRFLTMKAKGLLLYGVATLGCLAELFVLAQ
ncbi:MAG: acyltransferase family protein, partial [Lachnospiraceae bacterium]|nr:acyltransferase family protein [Lachnospiraceae bacterium]